MDLILEWCRRIWYLLNRRRFDEMLRQEMEAHRAMMDDPRRFGNTLRLREEAQDAWGWCWLDGLIRDTRLAIRALWRTPAFTIAALSSLALGFTLSASTTAVVNAYLLRSLPYPQADRLYHVMYAPPGPWEPSGLSAMDWESVNDVVEFPITSISDTFYLTEEPVARAVRGLRVTRAFVEGLDVRTSVGHTLSEQDFLHGSDQAALIGQALWSERYGSDPQILGRTIRVEGESRSGTTETFRIVGVLPEEFYFGRDSREKVDLLVPLSTRARTYMVRLREDVPPQLAEARITEAARRVSTDLPSNWSGVHLESAHGRYVAQLRPVLIGVTLASALVLIVVCANVAVLTLLRTMRRQKEIAVRVALGSARRHLLRMLVVETSILCIVSGALSVLLTGFGLDATAPLIETQLGRPAPRGTTAINVDATVLAVVGGIGVAVAFSLAFLPLLAPWQDRLAEALRREATTFSAGRRMSRARAGLVVFEVATTVVLLIGCGLMIRSAVRMLDTDLGMHTHGLVRARVILRAAKYPDSMSYLAFYERFGQRVQALTNTPIVLASWPPFAEHSKQDIEADGRSGTRAAAGALAVGPGFFETLGIRLRSGRDFATSDRPGAEPVAIVSDALARYLWPAGNVLGRQIRAVEQTPRGPRPGPWRTVVGVAADIRQTYGDREERDIYTPIYQATLGRFGSFYMRTELSSDALHKALRTALAEVDSAAIIDQPRSVDSENRQLASTKFLASTLSGFTGLATFVAVLGLYGVTAYAVQQRRREIAIRAALGATKNAIVRLFLRDGGLALAVGVGIGVVAALGLAQLGRSALAGLPPLDAVTVAATSGLLAAVGGVATWWPARRAATATPLQVLREG